MVAYLSHIFNLFIAIRLGREHIGKPVAIASSNASLITSGAMVVGAVGIAGAAYAVYWFFDTVYDIGEKAKDAGKDAWDAGTMPGEVQPQVSIVKSIFKSLGIL